jgi:hypothetical protein
MKRVESARALKEITKGEKVMNKSFVETMIEKGAMKRTIKKGLVYITIETEKKPCVECSNQDIFSFPRSDKGCCAWSRAKWLLYIALAQENHGFIADMENPKTNEP